MVFQEPIVKFVHIDMQLVTKSSTSCEGTGSEYSCDDNLVADMEICNCYNSPSQSVVGISKLVNTRGTSSNSSKNSDSDDHHFFNGFISFDK